jgi:ABC-type uncharacterized transport system permease subunit
MAFSFNRVDNEAMRQRGINVLVFAFIGVIIGLLLAGASGYDTIRDISVAMIAGGGLGALVGSQWTPARPRDHAGLEDKR